MLVQQRISRIWYEASSTGGRRSHSSNEESLAKLREA
jgi:hypothetical protein